jgi:hypothetical protein
MAQDRFRASNFLFLAPLRPFDVAQDMLCVSHLFSHSSKFNRGFQICLANRLLRNPHCRLLKKISEAYEGNGVLEYGNIGILGFKRIHPSFHPSTIPIFITLKRVD